MSSSTAEAASKVSFTIRRPTPVSRQSSSGVESDREASSSTFKVPALPRHVTESGRSTPLSPLANGGSRSGSGRSSRNGARPRGNYAERDSSDEEEVVDEIVTGFDQFGVQRCVMLRPTNCSGPQLTAALSRGNHDHFFYAPSLNEKKKEGPLVIPALKNRDWREIARKRKAAEMFVPGGGAAAIGPDGSVGGLGTKDSINSGPQLVGLIKTETKVKTEDDDIEMKAITQEDTVSLVIVEKKEETEDVKALKAILRSADPNAIPEEDDGFTIDLTEDDATWMKPKDEADAYRQDMLTRPDAATLEDYARVPVAEFGAALLRGMGWKPGMAASRTRTGLVEPYLPTARPALLGIGAKERVVEDDGSKSSIKGNKNSTAKRPERRYVPVIKREKTRDGDEGSVGKVRSGSRRTSMSPERERSDRRRDRDDRRRDRDHELDKGRSRYSDSDRRDDRRHNDRDSNYYRDRDRDRRHDKEYDGSGGRDSPRR